MEVLDGQHIIVEGINGSGKTFACKNGLLPLWKRIVVIDTEQMEFPEFESVSVKSAIGLMKSKHAFHVRVAFSGDMDTDLTKIEELARGVRSLGNALPPTVIYFDEFTDFADAVVIPKQLRSLIRTARKRKVSIIAGTQRPQLMNKTMVANSVHRLYFFMAEYDAEQIKAYAPFVKENLSSIPYGSYKSLYQSPDSSVVILAPFAKYDWASKKK